MTMADADPTSHLSGWSCAVLTLEAVLAVRECNKKECLVKWLGIGPEHDSWEPDSKMTNCSKVMQTVWDTQRSDTVLTTHAPGRVCLVYCRKYCKGPKLGKKLGHV